MTVLTIEVQRLHIDVQGESINPNTGQWQAYTTNFSDIKVGELAVRWKYCQDKLDELGMRADYRNLSVKVRFTTMPQVFDSLDQVKAVCEGGLPISDVIGDLMSIRDRAKA